MGVSGINIISTHLSVLIDGIALDPADPLERDIIKEYGLIKCILI